MLVSPFWNLDRDLDHVVDVDSILDMVDALHKADNHVGDHMDCNVVRRSDQQSSTRGLMQLEVAWSRDYLFVYSDIDQVAP